MYLCVCCFLPGKITLGDLKRCRMAHIFLDTFFNLEKYLDHEQRDPFAVQKVGIYIYVIFSHIAGAVSLKGNTGIPCCNREKEKQIYQNSENYVHV